jgi:hypothetical protein
MAHLHRSLDAKPSGGTVIETEPLRSVGSDEAELSTRHPFVAFKEVSPASGAWRVRIQSRSAAIAVLYPNALRLQARAVSEQGKTSFTWNGSFAGEKSNKFKVRVRVDHGEPAAIEVFPRPAAPGASQNSVTFGWPAA